MRAHGLESVVAWTLTPTRTGTHLRMEQSGFRPDQKQAYGGAKGGWRRFFAALEQLLARIDQGFSEHVKSWDRGRALSSNETENPGKRSCCAAGLRIELHPQAHVRD